MAAHEIQPIEIVFVTENGEQTANIPDDVNQQLLVLSDAGSQHQHYTMNEANHSAENNLMILSEASAQELVDGSEMHTVYITQPDGRIVASDDLVINGEEIITGGAESHLYDDTQEVRDDGYRQLGELVGSLEAALKNDQSKRPCRTRKIAGVGGANPYNCQVCFKTFQTVSNLNRHYRIHTGERPYLCKFCGKSYAQIDHLKRHVSGHTGDTPFVCNVCGKRYPEKNRYIVHLRSHSGERPFRCGVCDKGFAYKEGLTKHLRVHTGERSYECDYCMKRFSESQSLRIHRRIHTGERPYPCKFCFKSFITKKALRIHIRIHTGERPFFCSSCPKTFISKSSLNNHVKGHNSTPLPFACKVCDKRFQHQSTLRNHAYSHTKEKPFHCGVCFKRYRRRATLAVHMKIHVAEDNDDDVAAGVVDDGRRSRDSVVDDMYCAACDKQFTLSVAYEFHMKLHETRTDRHRMTIPVIGGNDASIATGFENHVEQSETADLPGVNFDDFDDDVDDERTLLESVAESGLTVDEGGVFMADRSRTFLAKSLLDEWNTTLRRKRRRSV